MSDSDAALQVLTDPVLFREVIAWTTGWPGLVAAKLFQRPNGRRWHFDSTATVTDALFRVADVKTLEVARSARWWNAAGELVGFELADVTQALRSGNAAAVQFVFATTDVRTGTYDMFYAYWSLGVSHCRGHHDVLDVLQEFVPPQQGLFKFVFSADYMFSIRHASVARWFVEHYGPGCLPTELILTALQRGCLGLFYYLRKIGGQAPSKLYELPDPVDKKRVKAIVQCDTNNTKRSRDRLLRLVARSDDIELIDQVLSDWSLQASASAVREATATLQQLADEGQMHLVRPRIEHLPTKTLEDNIPPRSSHGYSGPRTGGGGGYYEPQRPKRPDAPTCAFEGSAFSKCLQGNSANVAACQFYYTAWQACRARNILSPNATCVYATQAFSDCVSTNDDNLSACQFYYDLLQDCLQAAADH